jgi:hypothetical protein
VSNENSDAQHNENCYDSFKHGKIHAMSHLGTVFLRSQNESAASRSFPSMMMIPSNRALEPYLGLRRGAPTFNVGNIGAQGGSSR